MDYERDEGVSNMTEVRMNQDRIWESWDFKSDGGIGFMDLKQLLSVHKRH